MEFHVGDIVRANEAAPYVFATSDVFLVVMEEQGEYFSGIVIGEVHRNRQWSIIGHDFSDLQNKDFHKVKPGTEELYQILTIINEARDYNTERIPEEEDCDYKSRMKYLNEIWSLLSTV